MKHWLLSNGFFLDDDGTWFSVCHNQHFRARLDETFPPYCIDLYIPWGKAKNDGRQLWRSIGGSSRSEKLDEIIVKNNIKVGSKFDNEYQPVYLAL